MGGGFSLEASVGYTDARFTASTTAPNPLPAGWQPLVTKGDAISGEAAINYSPGTNPPWNVAVGPQYKFQALGHDAFVSFSGWQLAAFVDNLFDSHTTLNYALGQNDAYNPNGSPTPQQNAYTYRPRTVGITATFRN